MSNNQCDKTYATEQALLTSPVDLILFCFTYGQSFVGEFKRTYRAAHTGNGDRQLVALLQPNYNIGMETTYVFDGTVLTG